MCDEKQAVVGRAAGRKAQQKHDAQVAAEAVRAYQQAQQPAPARGWRVRVEKAEVTARQVLALSGALIFLDGLASGAVARAVHAAAEVSVIVMLSAAVLTAAVLAWIFGPRWWRLHRQPDFTPWNQPQVPAGGVPALDQLKPEVQALMRAGVIPQLEAWQGQPAITRAKVRK